jgi:hypothetical protein
LIFGGGGVAIALHINTPKPSPTPINTPPKPSPTPSPEGPTVDQVRAALLTSSDLASIDTNLMSVDLQMTGCNKVTVNDKIDLTRQYRDIAHGLILLDRISIFSSSSDAHIALNEASSGIACSLVEPYSLSNISSQLSGLCDESDAWKATYTQSNNVVLSNYFGIVRCGRAFAIFEVVTEQGSSFDNVNNLVTGMEIAVPKVEELR